VFPFYDLVTKVSVNGVKQQTSRSIIKTSLEYGSYGGNKHDTYLSKKPTVNTLNKNRKNLLAKFPEIWGPNSFFKYRA